MDITMILLRQVLIMLLLAGVGCIMFRTGKITTQGSRCLGNILIWLSLPSVIINSFLTKRTPALLTGLLISAAASAVLLALSIALSRVFFHKDPVACFASSFSNPGFFGIPLIAASLQDGAVFYIAAFIAFLNLLQWTYGVSLLTGTSTSMKPGTLLKAPFFIAILTGLFFFLTGLPMPGILSQSIGFMANLNTPLAMFVTGVYLAQTDLKKMLHRPGLYLICAVRLLLVPLLCIAALSLIPGTWFELKMAVLIASACPVGTNVAVYAQLHGKDYPYAVETVVMSTLFSIITIPLIVHLAGMAWSL